MQKQHKVNNSITAPSLRLIGEDNKQIGVVTREEALNYASGQDLDLVLISDSSNPPVAKVIDYKKFLYQEAKKEADAKKNQKNSGVKELKIGGPFTNERDVEIRMNRLKEMLADGFHVRLVIKFHGRQMAHPEFGHKIFDQITTGLADFAKIERERKFEGKMLTMVIGPKK